MTPFGQTSVRTTTIPHHTERGTATTAHNARLQAHDLHFLAMMDRALAEAWRWDERNSMR